MGTKPAVDPINDDFTEWTNEELRRGAKKGHKAPAPGLIPRACHEELLRRQGTRAHMRMIEELDQVTEEYLAIAKGQALADPSRIRAIEGIMNRVLGKAPERVQISAEEPWMKALKQVIVVPDEDDDVIDIEAEDEILWEDDD